VIRYKHVGPITADVVTHEFRPALQALSHEAAP